MMIIEGGEVYLIDRSYRFFFLERLWNNPPLPPNTTLDPKTTFLGMMAGSILDGEMVYHQESSLPYFLIFDVLSFKRQYIGSKMLGERLEHIGQTINLFRSNILQPDWQNPFQLIGKMVVPCTSIHNITDCIKELPKVGVTCERIYQDTRRFHKTDGLIFTPGREYRLFTDDDLYKWKYADMQTVDFSVEPGSTRNTFRAKLQGDKELVTFKELMVPEEDAINLLRDINAPMGEDNLNRLVVGEFCFDPKIGLWRYLMHRKDKSKPNHIKVFGETMESIVENTTLEDIKRCLSYTNKHKKVQPPPPQPELEPPTKKTKTEEDDFPY